MGQYFSVEQMGNKMLVRQDQQGHIKDNFIEGSFHPVLYERSAGDTGFKDLFGKNLKPVVHEDLSGAREWLRNRKGISNADSFGNQNFYIQYINEHFTSDYDFSKIRIFYLDIEVLSRNPDGSMGAFPEPDESKYPVTAITIYDSINGWKQWGLEDFTPKEDAEYFHLDSEKELLNHFLDYWAANCPHIVTSWNGDSFDMPYLINRSAKVLGGTAPNRLSPFGKIREKSHTDGYGNDTITYQIYGVQQLDYLELYKEFTYTMRSNYRLDTIGEIECGIGKVSFGEYKNFVELYEGDHQRYMEYNRVDVEIIVALNNKLRLLELIVEMAYTARINYSDVFSPVRLWDATIYHSLLEEGIVIPINSSGESEEYPGGYVKSPPKGMQKHIMSFDLASLYPSIIRGWNLGMETIAHKSSTYTFEDVVEGNLSSIKGSSYAANGWNYINDKQSLYSKLMESAYNKRVIVKGEMLDKKRTKQEMVAENASPAAIKQIDDDIARLNTKQMGIKISINSFYGILANKHFRFFDVRIAESITTNGQMAIQYIAKTTSDYINELLKTEDIDYCVYIDTDSIYLNVEGFIDKLKVAKPDADPIEYLDKVGQKLNKFIDSSYRDLRERLDLREHMLLMDREGIFSRGIWTAKKRYLLLVHDMEGVRYQTPELKIQGLETQRSSTPPVFKTKLKDMYMEILTKDNDYVIKSIDDFRKEIDDIDLNDIASPTGVNGINKYSQDGYPIKGTPGHVRASISYNREVQELGLENKYPLIRDGDKIVTVSLCDPNPLKEKSFAYVDVFPKETGLYKYIDREAMLEKDFLKPLRSVLNIIDWDVEHKSSLNSFFG